ncbi:twitching motility protein PilT [Parelusimicrobium proximum]|uniref:type IV pilus twitching motility protein PilT n=1 Tax=Parelusimicrobium proximum TaxID=3228953 RepID=UPI003D176573
MAESLDLNSSSSTGQQNASVGLRTLLKTVVDNKASGLHLRGNSFAYVRLNTQIKQIEDSFLSNEEVIKIAYSCMGPRERKIFEENHTVDFSMDAKEYGRFRFNVYRQSNKMCIAIRYIPMKIPAFEDLNLPAAPLAKICEQKRGLVLVTGMTGSGKSSTLAAMLGQINRTRRGHILTIEDPIEFIHQEEKCLISQMALEVDTRSYMMALRAAMRQDPDVIMIGEMRDSEVIRSAILAAETGHLVFSTVHTTNVVQTINRVIEAFPFEQQAQVRQQLSDFLKGVISQRLLPCTEGGMIPAVEVMVDTAQIKKLIADNKIGDIQKYISDGAYYGMQSFDQALINLVLAGKITVENALANASSPDLIMLAIKGVSSEKKEM